MPLDTITLLLQVQVGLIGAILVTLVTTMVGVAIATRRLSRRLDCAIQQASPVPAATVAEPDGSKLPELDPWQGDDSLDDLLDRSP